MHILYLIGILLAFVSLLWIAKKVQDAFEKNLDYEIEEKNNYFAALNRAGYLVGTGIAMLGALRSHANVIHWDWLIAEIVQILIFVQIADKITMKYLLSGMNVKRHSDIATGCVALGVNLGTGVIAFGAFSGLGGEWYNPVIFFVLGQIILIVVARIYQHFIVRSWHLVDALKTNNVGAGLMLMSSLLSISVIIAGATSGDSHGLLIDLMGFSVSIVTGIVLVLVALISLIDWLFLPNTTISKEIATDKQAAPILLVALLKIFFSIVAAVII